MPRYYYDGARDTVDGQKKISIFWLRQKGYLEGFSSGVISWTFNGKPSGKISFEISIVNDAYMRFSYKIKNSWEPESEYRNYDYKYSLESLPCRFGGKRWFFRCGVTKNGRYCGRRVGILYLIGSYFMCRHCSDLSYDSCNTNKKYRWLRRVIGKDQEMYDRYNSLRTRYYKGKPTKKYQKIIDYWEEVGDTDFEQVLKESV